MTDSFLARLQEATRLVRLGQTSGATRLIQSNLMGERSFEHETPAPTVPAGRPRRPLPEVTRSIEVAPGPEIPEPTPGAA